jgi:hypothetical protein
VIINPIEHEKKKPSYDLRVQITIADTEDGLYGYKSLSVNDTFSLQAPDLDAMFVMIKAIRATAETVARAQVEAATRA